MRRCNHLSLFSRRCSISADSHIVNSESDDQTDDESVDVKDTGCHNIRNEAAHERRDAQTDDDQDRVLRGKMSESNGYAGSDFYGYTAQKSPSVGPIDSSGEEGQTIQRLGITKNDLRHRIAKEARGNAVLQASPERRKQALHECRLALEHDVQRLQSQLQAERDLRAALEVGLSMSPGQLSSSHRMDPKIKAELEEIALAEADVARLKKKVAELHLQLSLQRPHHFGSLSNASVRSLLQQDFDSTLAFYTHERKLENEEILLRPELSPVRGCMLEAGGRTRHPPKQFVDLGSLSGSNSAESLSHSASMPSTARLANVLDFPRQTSVAASTLPELTTRLDFFKKWRPQLMEQLHDLELNYGLGISHDYFHRPSQPSWS